ncbi:MAG: PIN domain-containing protein [Planctomycetaceae bacterium]
MTTAERVVIDAGPLVALLKSDDAAHTECEALVRSLRTPFYTTWPVVTEVAWLLRKRPDGPQSVLALVESGLVVCLDLGPDAPEWMRAFLDRYADLRPQLADASLVYAAEKLGTETIFTLDRRDFHVFRSASGRSFRLLPETA